MKVIEVGNTSKKLKCPACSSKLEYEPSDVVFEEDYRYIVCPVCNTEIRLKRSDDFPEVLYQVKE